MIDVISNIKESIPIDRPVTTVSKSNNINLNKNESSTILSLKETHANQKVSDIVLQSVGANEVKLDNVQFAYNQNTKDFIVKVERGEANFQYPTEAMMKLKEFILTQNNQSYVNNLAKERVDLFLN